MAGPVFLDDILVKHETREDFYSTSQTLTNLHIQGFSLFLLVSTMQNNIEDIKTLKKHIWIHVVTKKVLKIF